MNAHLMHDCKKKKKVRGMLDDFKMIEINSAGLYAVTVLNADLVYSPFTFNFA